MRPFLKTPLTNPPKQDYLIVSSCLSSTHLDPYSTKAKSKFLPNTKISYLSMMLKGWRCFFETPKSFLKPVHFE